MPDHDAVGEPEGGRPQRRTARTLLSGTSWQTLSQVLPLVINLAMTPWIIHGLGAQRYSIFLLVTTFTMVLSQFDGGIGPSAMRFFSIYAGRDDRAAATRLLLSVSALIFAVSALVTSVAFLFSDAILGAVKVDAVFLPEARFLFRTLTAIIALILVRNLINAILNSRQQFRYTSLAILAGYVIYMTGLVLTVVQGWGLYGIAVTMVIQQVVGSLITVPPGLRYLTRPSPVFMSRTEFREFFGYASRVQVTGITTLLTGQKDQLVAGYLISAQQSGPYGQGTNFATQLKTLPLNATYPMQAMIGSEVAVRSPHGAKPKVEKLQRIWVVAVTGWCAVGVPATYYGVQAWLPDSFVLAAPVAAVLLAGTYAALLMFVTKLWALTLGRSDIEMRAGIVGLAANVGLSIALWFPLGMMGVVWATALSQVVTTAYFSLETRRSLAENLRWFVRDVPVLATLAGASLCWLLEWLAFGHLPRGALGLLSAGLLAVPGMALFVALSFGHRGLREARDLLRP